VSPERFELSRPVDPVAPLPEAPELVLPLLPLAPEPVLPLLPDAPEPVLPLLPDAPELVPLLLRLAPELVLPAPVRPPADAPPAPDDPLLPVPDAMRALVSMYEPAAVDDVAEVEDEEPPAPPPGDSTQPVILTSWSPPVPCRSCVRVDGAELSCAAASEQANIIATAADSTVLFMEPPHRLKYLAI